MIWNTITLRKYMLKFYKKKTDPDDPNFSFIEKLKELWGLIDSTDISMFTNRKKMKIYDLYPLRNELEKFDDGQNRFRMEQMADAGEVYGELLNIIFEKWASSNISIKLEKHYTWKWGVKKIFPLDESCMMIIVIADLFMMDHTFTEDDDYQILDENYGTFPKALSYFLTRDLVYLEKEHLRAWRLYPEDWQSKLVKLKSPDRPTVTSIGSTASSSENEPPDILSINLTWTQSNQSQILTILTMLPSKFKLSQMFELSSGTVDKQYYFKGMICFWGLHYFWYIRHITSEGEVWLEYNDEEIYHIVNWHYIVSEWVKDCNTPTLLLFENVDVVDYPQNIDSLRLSDEELAVLKEDAFTTSRVARIGRVDLNPEKSKYGKLEISQLKI